MAVRRNASNLLNAFGQIARIATAMVRDAADLLR